MSTQYGYYFDALAETAAIAAEANRIVLPHSYDRAPVTRNGPLLCTCGEPLVHRLHPHEPVYRPAIKACVCGMPMRWPGHLY